MLSGTNFDIEEDMNIKTKHKTKKEEKKMKKTTLTTVLIITMVFIFSTVSYAQGNSSAQNGAMAYAYRAQQKIRANELQVQVKEDKRVQIAANVMVIDDENMPVKLETEEDK